MIDQDLLVSAIAMDAAVKLYCCLKGGSGSGTISLPGVSIGEPTVENPLPGLDELHKLLIGKIKANKS